MVSLCFVHPNSTLVFCAIYPAFPQKWLRLQKLQFFLSQFPLPSLEGDNNIYIYIIIIYYYYLQSESSRNPLYPLR